VPAGSRNDWRDDETLRAAQERLAALRPEPWYPGPEPLVAAGCFVAFRRGEAGPGHAGDRAWSGAALVAEGGRLVATAVVEGMARRSYEPGLLARREGDLLLDALLALPGRGDVLLVDATGRDHPRGAGLALHLGALLDLPSVGVTHRTLLAEGEPAAGEGVGSTAPVRIGAEVVGRWLRTRAGARPVLAHAAWRTDAETASEVVRRMSLRARTPEPLRLARMAAREARAVAEGRAPPRRHAE
jgi:deoxyribonuclease V